MCMASRCATWWTKRAATDTSGGQRGLACGCCLQRALEKGKNLLPGVRCLLRAVVRTVGGKEPVARGIVAVELVVLAQVAQDRLRAIDLVGVGTGVVVAEDAQQRTPHLGR